MTSFLKAVILTLNEVKGKDLLFSTSMKTSVHRASESLIDPAIQHE